MKRVRLGNWTTASGNSCDVFLVGDEGPTRHLAIEWDRFPLSAAEERDYTARILPAVTQRALECLELPGAAIVARAR